MLAFSIFSLWRFLFQHISYFRISCSWQKHVILSGIWFMACISHLQISLLYCHFLCDLYIGIFYAQASMSYLLMMLWFLLDGMMPWKFFWCLSCMLIKGGARWHLSPSRDGSGGGHQLNLFWVSSCWRKRKTKCFFLPVLTNFLSLSLIIWGDK